MLDFGNNDLVSLADVGVISGYGGDRVSLCEQGTDEWLSIRRGCISASRMSEVICPGSLKPSKSRTAYMYELAAERVSGQSEEHYVSAAMRRGTELEDDARDWYVENVRPVTQVGFVFSDPGQRTIGCSPDGLCSDRGIEIKVLLPKNHCRLLRDRKIDRGYWLQMQFGMWITGLTKWDHLVFQPVDKRIPQFMETVTADSKVFAAFYAQLPAFDAEIAEAVKAIKGDG